MRTWLLSSALVLVSAAAVADHNYGLIELVHNRAAQLHLNDDVQSSYGNTAAAPDFWCEHDTSTTPDEWACTSTDIDGGGTDGRAFSVAVGTDDIVIYGSCQGANTNGPYIENAASSATNPTLVPDRASLSAGVGGTSGDVSFITSGAERINIDTAGTVTNSTRHNFTGIIHLNDGSAGANDGLFGIGTSDDARLQYNTTQTPDTLNLGVSADSRALVICETGDMSTDFAHALQANPTIFVHSADQTSITEALRLTHDGTDAIVGSGSGDVGIADDGSKGVTTYIRTATQSLTFAADPGDATKVTSGLVPDGAMLMGITTRVTTTATNCTSVSIGDGTDPDMFGATTGITSATTTTNADATAQFGRSPATAAMEVTITANGGNCFDGVFAVTAHYVEPAAATSN